VYIFVTLAHGGGGFIGYDNSSFLIKGECVKVLFSAVLHTKHEHPEDCDIFM
jgi:hypothetical protein